MNGSSRRDTPTIDASASSCGGWCELTQRPCSRHSPTSGSVATCRARISKARKTSDWLTDPTWSGRRWVAIDKTAKAVAGRFIVAPSRDAGVAELGYVTVLDRHGQGVALACVSALIAYLFEIEGLRRVFAEIDAANSASITVAERLGFTREGCLREHEITHEGLRDLVFYGLLRRDWGGREYGAPSAP